MELPIMESLYRNNLHYACGSGIITYIIITPVGRGSSVGIDTRYGLDGLGIEFRLGVRFSALFQTGPGPNQPPI